MGQLLIWIGLDRTLNLCRQLRQQAPFLPLCFESRSVLTQQGVFEALTPTAADPFYDLGNWQLHLAG